MKIVVIFLFHFSLGLYALTGWTDPLPVTTTTGTIQDFAFSISPDTGAGLFSCACNGGSAVNGIYLKQRASNSLSWSQNIFLSTENNDAVSPSVTGLNNYSYSAWLDKNSGSYRVLFCRNGEGAIELSGGGNCTSINIFAGANNCVHAAWAEGGIIYYRKGFNNGANWSAVRTVSGVPADKPLVYEADGKLLLLWQGGPLPVVRYSLSADGGVTWGTEANLSSFSSASLSGAVDSFGFFYAVWEQANKIYFKKYGSRGWEMEKTVSTNTSGTARYPAVTADTDGVIYIFWTDNRSGNYRLYAASSNDSGMSFAAETELASLPAAEKIIAGSYKNNLHLFWKESGQIFFRVKDTAAPYPVQIASPSHNKKGFESSNNCPVFCFTAFDNDGGTGIKGLSFSFDKEPAAEPVTAVNFTGTTLSFPNTANGRWYLHVKSVDALGNWSSAAHYAVIINNTSLLPENEVWCFPNPVRTGSPKIRYFVPEAASISLTVFNEAGEIFVLNKKDAVTGVNEIKDLETAGWANGVYFFKLQAKSAATGNSAQVVKKMVLLR